MNENSVTEQAGKIMIIFLKQTFFEENNEKNRGGNLKWLPNGGKWKWFSPVLFLSNYFCFSFESAYFGSQRVEIVKTAVVAVGRYMTDITHCYKFPWGKYEQCASCTCRHRLKKLGKSCLNRARLALSCT